MTSTKWVVMSSLSYLAAMMKLLLDTHLLLWAAGLPNLLPEPARNMIEDSENKLS
jgi:hypothetical protein